MSAVRIKGAVDPAEVAAVLALLARDGGGVKVSGYDRWRMQRLRAVRRSYAVGGGVSRGGSATTGPR